MPKRIDIKKILVIGAGPIIIGQACEFDYSGTQACKALKDEGYKVILINSNPATIMTDPEVADKTYIEPISLEVLEEVIKKERPDAILPTMGGQTALNLAIHAKKKGLRVLIVSTCSAFALIFVPQFLVRIGVEAPAYASILMGFPVATGALIAIVADKLIRERSQDRTDPPII